MRRLLDVEMPTDMLRKLINRLVPSSHAEQDIRVAVYRKDEVERLIAQGDQAEAEGNLREACEHYRRAVEAAPQHAKARLNLGVALEAIEDADGAIESYEAALAIDPENAYANYNLGKVLYTRGELPRAEELLRAALKHKPEFPEAQVVLSSVYEAQGNLTTAAAALEVALKQQPDWAGALFNYGTILKKLGRLSEAEAALSRAIALDPGNADACYELASLLQDRGALQEAEKLLRQTLEHNPDFPEAHAALGILCKNLGDLLRAESCFRRAIALKPNYVGAYYLLGDVLFNRGDRNNALDAFEKAIALQPEFFRARWARAMAQVPAVYGGQSEIELSREAFDREISELRAWVGKNAVMSAHEAVGAIPPFYLAYTEENNRDLLALHGELCADLMGDWLRSLAPVAVSRTDYDRIEIGIVSAHIFDHSVWNAIIKGWIKHLDASRFSLSFFHLDTESDDETRFARSRSSHFEDGKRALEEWVRSILSRRPDILIYAEIGMDPIPLKLASLRLAPIQAATWGHPETTGLPTVDYYLSAEYLEPAGAEANYTESLIKLPGLGVCYEPLPIAHTAPDLEALGIDGNCPLLLSPGTPFKYSPRYDWVYVDIARRLGDCQVIFFTGHKSDLSEILRHRLQLAFCGAGLDFDRYVRFVPWLNRGGFHGLMRRADVFLDPIGFSGFNTAIEAVECELPVVTREGRFMRGRLASAILERMNLHDLVARTEQEYINLAVRLASDSAYRDCVRSRMAQARAILYNDIAPVRALEGVLERIAGKGGVKGV